MFGFLRSLKSAIYLIDPTEVIIATDGPKSGLRRKMLFKEYKSNRRKPWKRGSIRAFDFLSEQEQNDNFSYQITRVREYLSTLPVKTLSIPFVEADDIIAHVCNTLDDDSEAVVYSTDADYLQLLSKNRYCFNPITKVLTYREKFIEDHGFLPENYIFIKAASGDKSDNIPGIRGIGEKTMLKLFPEMKDEFLGLPQDVLEKCRRAVNSGSKEYTRGQINGYKKILENEDILLRNYHLMQLRDVDISLQSKNLITDMMKHNPNEFKRSNLRRMFIEDKLYGQVKFFEEWANDFDRLQRR